MKFEFWKCFSPIVDMLKVKNTKMKAFGRNATEAELVVTIMESMEAATEHNYR